jgi:beta-lactamase class D
MAEPVTAGSRALNRFFLATLSTLVLAVPVAAEARTICTLVADAADGKVITEDGDCRTRVTPASTFKIPLALMGFDSGFLQDAHAPVLPFKPGYPDFGGANWTQPTEPTRWMKYSVVWYSQQITKALGAERLGRYAESFGYGNADFSGDPGKNNGLERAWIISSLKVSPREQVAFLARLVNRTLPVTPETIEKVDAIVEHRPIGEGWEAHGKTGMAYPRKPDGTFDESRAYGWFVGWAVKDDRTLVFARLIQDDQKEEGTAGNRARDAFLGELPKLVGQGAR